MNGKVHSRDTIASRGGLHRCTPKIAHSHTAMRCSATGLNRFQWKYSYTHARIHAHTKAHTHTRTHTRRAAQVIIVCAGSQLATVQTPFVLCGWRQASSVHHRCHSLECVGLSKKWEKSVARGREQGQWEGGRVGRSWSTASGEVTRKGRYGGCMCWCVNKR